MSTSGVQSHSDSDVATYLYNDPNDPFFSYVECIDWTNEVCHHWHVNFNQGQGPYTQGERDSLACHEFGHTTGLHHYGSHQFIATCMENVDWHQNFNSHDVTHINNRYEEGEVTMGHRIQWVALSVMIGMLLPAFASCADDPDPRGTAREVYFFENLDQLVATAPIALRGSVTDVKEGETFGAGEAVHRVRIGIVKVSEVIYGDVPGTIWVAETGVNGVPYLEEGDEGIFFVFPEDGLYEGVQRYRSINSQARLVIDDGAVSVWSDELPWLRALEGANIEDAEQAIRESLARVEAEGIDPVGPPLPADR